MHNQRYERRVEYGTSQKFDEQNYKDTTSVFEKYTIRGIIVRDGKIAMQCSKEGEYKIPGGGMEAGETYVEALAREVKEETGLFIIPEKQWNSVRF